jgi:hypothetical protein
MAGGADQRSSKALALRRTHYTCSERSTILFAIADSWDAFAGRVS